VPVEELEAGIAELMRLGGRAVVLSRLAVKRETVAKLMAETPCKETEAAQAGESVKLAAATVSSPFAGSWRREWSGR
jgi:hypothetical protein